jgi:hypothetical protein
MRGELRLVAETMPRHIKLIARFGNALAAILWGLAALMALSRHALVPAVLIIAYCALAIFNLYVIEKCIRSFSEEGLLQAEVRKAELRQKLAGMGGHTRRDDRASGGQ